MTLIDTKSIDLEKLREHFDRAPYPRVPLEQSPQTMASKWPFHNPVTPYYLKYRQVIETPSTLILDAGCGTGYKALVLAETNPGATVVGVDFSEESIRLATERAKYHTFKNVEFHILSITDLPSLGLEFDYINCDEVLYLVPDPLEALQAMKAVLKPQGIIRANLHNAYQRSTIFRAQALFNLIGVMEEPSEDTAYELVLETIQALQDSVNLKKRTWRPRSQDPDHLREMVFANQLLTGDKGFTVLDLFALLRASDLEFINMVNWRHWDPMTLFKDPNSIPPLWTSRLANASIEEKLHVYELVNPIHRLMDFWCTPAGQPSGIPLERWTEANWHTAEVYLHPNLRTAQLREELVDCITHARPLEISRDLPSTTTSPELVDSSLASCLLPLWEGSQSIYTLVERYRLTNPVEPVTLNPLTATMAWEAVKGLLTRLEAFPYVLLVSR